MTASSAVLEQAALSVAAHRRIKRWLTLTPCIPSRLSFDDDTGLVFKAENLLSLCGTTVPKYFFTSSGYSLRPVSMSKKMTPCSSKSSRIEW